MKTILILGGYGNFGGYIAQSLSGLKKAKLIIAGRSKAKAEAFCASLGTVIEAEPLALDISQGLNEALDQLQPDIVIHTCGPYQEQSYHVAEACITHGCHYLDLADAREFVTGITALDAAAKTAGVLVVSGASSVPGLSSAIIDHYLRAFEALEEVHYGIATAQQTNRGLATTSAVLGYAGQPFKTLINGAFETIYGWQSLHRHSFKDIGKKLLGNCDIPDLELFPKAYASLKTQRFYAGLEVPIVHLGLWGLSWLRRWRLLPSLSKFAPLLLKTSFLFDPLGSDTSAFFMTLKGHKKGTPKTITFDLVARDGDGPYIPCMPIILLAKKLVGETLDQKGAVPCLGLVTLDDYLDGLKALNIDWRVEGAADLGE